MTNLLGTLLWQNENSSSDCSLLTENQGTTLNKYRMKRKYKPRGINMIV